MKIKDVDFHFKRFLDPIDRRDARNPNSEELLAALFGQDAQRPEDYISNLTSFAGNSEMQIVYELMQNAEDEKGDYLVLEIINNFLVVGNNGKPFWNSSEGLGPLWGFLREKKGKKKKDPEKKGEYGIGSKLIYDLISNAESTRDGQTEKGARLVEALIRDRKAPFLFSWEDIKQLESLRYGIFMQRVELSREEHAALLVKLFHSYFPVVPLQSYFVNDQEEILFTESDLKILGELTDKFFQSFSSFSQFTSGSLLFIPLGEGRAARLMENFNTSASGDDLVTNMRISLSTLDHLRYVYFNRQKIVAKDDGLRLPIRDEGGAIGEIYLPDPSEIMPGNSINVFKFFPYQETTFGFQFVLNLPQVQGGQNRQSIDLDAHHNSKLFAQTAQGIILQMKKLEREGDFDTLFYVHQAILQSNLDERLRENQVILFSFLENLLSGVKGTLITEVVKGEGDELIILDSGLPLDKSYLTNNSYSWISKRYIRLYEALSEKLELQKKSIGDLLDENEIWLPDGIRDWVFGLEDIQYADLIEELSHSHKGSISRIPFIKFSDGQVYSVSDILQSEELVYLPANLSGLRSILMDQGVIVSLVNVQMGLFSGLSVSTLRNFSKALERINKVLDPAKMNRDQKWNFFLAIKNSGEDVTTFLSEELILWKIQDSNDYGSLNEFIWEPSDFASSGILSGLGLSLTEIRPFMQPFVVPEKEAWNLIQDNWSRIVSNITRHNYEQALFDLNVIHGKANLKTKLKEDKKWILTFDDELHTTQDVFYTNRVYELNEQRRIKLANWLKSSCSLFLPNDLFLNHPLVREDSIAFSDVREGNLQAVAKWFKPTDWIPCDKEIVELLWKVKTEDELFFEYFLIKMRGGILQIRKKEGSGLNQFFVEEPHLRTFLNTQPDFIELPDMLQRNPVFVKEAKQVTPRIQALVENYPGEEALIWSVIEQDDRLKKNYLDQFSSFQFFTNDERENYQEEFEGELVRLLVRQNWEEDYKQKMSINGVPWQQFTWSGNVLVSGTSRPFSLMKLLPDLEVNPSLFFLIKQRFLGQKTGKLFFQQDYPQEDLFNELWQKDQLSSADQVAYMVAFLKEQKNTNLKARETQIRNFKTTELLQSFYSYQITGFTSYLEDIFFDPAHYIHLESKGSELMYHGEELPEWCRNWLWSEEGTMQEKLKFLQENGLQVDSSPVIAAREIWKGSRKYTTSIFKTNSSNWPSTSLWENTLEWFRSVGPVKISKEGQKDSYHLICWVVKSFVEKYEQWPKLVPTFNCDTDTNTVSISLKDLQKSKAVFLRKFQPDFLPVLRALESDGLGQFIDLTSGIYDATFWKVAKNLELRELRLQIKRESLERNKEEWTSPIYQEWKKEYTKYTFWTTRESLDIHYQYSVSYNNKEQDNEWQEVPGSFSGDVLLEEDSSNKKTVGLYMPEEKTSILEVIKGNKNVIFSTNEQEDFVALLSQFTLSDEHTQIIESIGPEGIEIITQEGLSGSEIIKRLKGEGDGNVDMGEINDKEKKDLQDNASSLKKLLAKYQGKELTEIVEDIEKMVGLFNEQNEKLKINQISGLIGELFIYHWLKGRFPGVKIKSIEENPEPRVTWTPFDLELIFNGRTYAIEVKTTLKSINTIGESMPFYLKDSQYEEMKYRPEGRFVMVRVGLADFGLTQLFDRYKKLSAPFDVMLVDHFSELNATISEQAKAIPYEAIKENLQYFSLYRPKGEGGLPF